jgi:hypothetical protein
LDKLNEQLAAFSTRLPAIATKLAGEKQARAEIVAP